MAYSKIRTQSGCAQRRCMPASLMLNITKRLLSKFCHATVPHGSYSCIVCTADHLHVYSTCVFVYRRRMHHGAAQLTLHPLTQLSYPSQRGAMATEL